MWSSLRGSWVIVKWWVRGVQMQNGPHRATWNKSFQCSMTVRMKYLWPCFCQPTQNETKNENECVAVFWFFCRARVKATLFKKGQRPIEWWTEQTNPCSIEKLINNIQYRVEEDSIRTRYESNNWIVLIFGLISNMKKICRLEVKWLD